jgi:hypothetical protein
VTLVWVEQGVPDIKSTITAPYPREPTREAVRAVAARTGITFS